LSARADRARQALRDGSKVAATGIDQLQELTDLLVRERDWYVKISTGWLTTVLQQLGDPLLVTEWAGFVHELKSTRERVLTLRAGLRAHTVKLPDQIPAGFVTDLTDARDRLATGGKLGMFARDAKRAMEKCLVDGEPPTTQEQVQWCLDGLEVERLRHRIANTWHNQTGHLGAPPLVGYPELTLPERLEEVEAAQSARQRWTELSQRLGTAGFPVTARPSPESLDQLSSLCQDAIAALTQSAIRGRLGTLRQELVAGAAGQRPSPEWMELADAVAAGNVVDYQAHWDAVGQLEQLVGPAARLTSLQRRLAAVAPEWTGIIARDPAAAGRPADFAAAWQWRQLETWLQYIASLPDPAVLQANLEELAADRRRTVTELVTERAWRRLADNLGRPERQALQSYVAAVARFGKTGGKYAQRWIGEMRAALDDAKTAVPVWIMPTSRALSSFRPTAVPPFDVLIIDEASQIGFEALPLLALSTSTIVVGDDKQTSPEHVGLDRARIFDLMDDYLREIPRYRTVFDPDRSLYDLATLRFSTPIMLTEHFRCLPEIIAFSNHQAYGDQIIPLRDQPPHPGWVPLGLVRVMDGYRSGDLNEPEAAQVVSLIREMCDDPKYDGMTFGVISLLGTQQSKRIWELLYDQLGPDLVAQRQIRCGEAANFQGDERDVMVLSTVVAVDPGASNTRFSAMTGTAALRRINVAASRARNQMWVVTSVDPAALSAGDLRAELIRHCAAPPAGDERQQDLLAACESEFERRVVRSLQARGYRAIEVQHKVGQYRLDIVVAGPDGRLAIECDGDRWHGEDVWHKDRARQEVLERAGWTFERIRGSSFFRDPDRAMEPVWRHLAGLGIPTGDEWIVNSPRGVTREVSGAPEERAGGPAHVTGDPPIAEIVLTTTDPEPPKSAPSAVPVTTESIDDRPADRAPVDSSGLLQPFTSWPTRALPPVDSDDTTAVMQGLAEIIRAEGPMYALQAYQRYAKASGVNRVGREAHRHFDALNVRGVRTGHWLRLKDRVSDPSGATLYAPDSPPVVLRQRGPRDLMEIPRSEIKTLMDALDLDANPAELKRAVLRELGFIRMTERTSEYLDQCLRYTWTT
ncbi:MAG: AAA domain-containing protein, partial [Nakamurella sp.]